MNWKQQHIGIDLSLKTQNSNLFGRYLAEEKDYILNKVINDLVHKTAEDARNSVMNVESYADIVNFYNVLEPLLITRRLDSVANVGRYNSYNLPRNLEVLSTQGSEIIAGVTYRIDEVGNINTINNVSPYGIGTTLHENDKITLPAQIEVFKDVNGVFEFKTYVDFKYRVIRDDGLGYGDVGNVFIETQNQTFVYGDTNSGIGETQLEIISHTPTSWGNTSLTAIKKLDCFDYISIKTLISTNKYIRSSNDTPLKKGEWYRVTNAGDFTDLISFGSSYNAVEQNYIFICTNSGTPTWITSPVLELLIESPCRLVKPQDTSNFLNHSYGTTASSPIATLGDGMIQIYHDNKFNIVDVQITYVRPPATIDSVADVSCDLNPNLHPTLVTLAVQDITSTNNPQLYPTVNAQVKQQQTK